MSLLAIQYPFKYFEAFDPLNDFEVLDMSILSRTHPKFDHPVWLDFSKGSQRCLYQDSVEGFILMQDVDPDRNLVIAMNARTPDHTNIATWVGSPRHLKLLEETVDIVAVPWNKYRGVCLNAATSDRYHFTEFSSLDELRRLPCRSLHTSVPITAALLGIDLTTRERRPTHLPAFSYELTLTAPQLDLAVANVNAIRKALNGEGNAL